MATRFGRLQGDKDDPFALCKWEMHRHATATANVPLLVRGRDPVAAEMRRHPDDAVVGTVCRQAGRIRAHSIPLHELQRQVVAETTAWVVQQAAGKPFRVRDHEVVVHRRPLRTVGVPERPCRPFMMGQVRGVVYPIGADTQQLDFISARDKLRRRVVEK